MAKTIQDTQLHKQETATAKLVGKIQDQGLELRKAQQQLAAIRYLVDNVTTAPRQTLDLIGDIADGKIVDHPDGI